MRPDVQHSYVCLQNPLFEPESWMSFLHELLEIAHTQVPKPPRCTSFENLSENPWLRFICVVLSLTSQCTTSAGRICCSDQANGLYRRYWSYYGDAISPPKLETSDQLHAMSRHLESRALELGSASPILSSDSKRFIAKCTRKFHVLKPIGLLDCHLRNQNEATYPPPSAVGSNGLYAQDGTTLSNATVVSPDVDASSHFPGSALRTEHGPFGCTSSDSVRRHPREKPRHNDAVEHAGDGRCPHCSNTATELPLNDISELESRLMSKLKEYCELNTSDPCSLAMLIEKNLHEEALACEANKARACRNALNA